MQLEWVDTIKYYWRELKTAQHWKKIYKKYKKHGPPRTDREPAIWMITLCRNFDLDGYPNNQDYGGWFITEEDAEKDLQLYGLGMSDDGWYPIALIERVNPGPSPRYVTNSVWKYDGEASMFKKISKEDVPEWSVSSFAHCQSPRSARK